jgi:bifunctional DNA-binding transcriptional regulator/antitoxin component of YhaV-PrlF toxin-antitoxin module
MDELWRCCKGGVEIIPFDGRVVRVDKEGKQVTIPVKYGQPFRIQPGDQLRRFFDLTKFGTQKKLTPQQQRDEANKKMPYGDKLVDAAKMVPDLLKGDAKAAYNKMVSDPGFVAQLVAVSAVFAALQATPAGPLIDGALVAYLGFSAGCSRLAVHRTKLD